MKKYQIEICGKKNESVIFPLMGQGTKVRGRWDFQKITHRRASQILLSMSSVGYFPGEVIELDLSKKTGKIFDPIKEDIDSRKKLGDVKHLYDAHQEVLGAFPRGNDMRQKLDLEEDEIKTWLYHMRVLVDNGMAVKWQDSPELPELKEIKAMQGRRISDPGNSGRKDKDLAEYRYTDEVQKKSRSAS